MSLSFSSLLESAGARPGRYECGKWFCWRCEGKSPSLSVDGSRELFHCHRCGQGGGRRTLEKELGFELEQPSRAAIRKRERIRQKSEQFAAWAASERLRAAVLLRNTDAAEWEAREAGRAALGRGEPIPEKTWDLLQFAAHVQEAGKIRFSKLCDVAHHLPELMAEFSGAKTEAA